MYLERRVVFYRFFCGMRSDDELDCRALVVDDDDDEQYSMHLSAHHHHDISHSLQWWTNNRNALNARRPIQFLFINQPTKMEIVVEGPKISSR